MKKIYFLLIIFFSFSLTAQIVNISDANFKAKLIALGIDTNNDGNIQVSEAAVPTILYLDNSNIQNITGIKSFVNLNYLRANNNSIVNADLSGMINLIRVNLQFNQSLSSINVSGCTNLEELFSYDCNLNQLNISNLNNLKKVSCSQNYLTNLSITNCPNFKELICSSNNLTSLNLSEFVNLEILSCRNNNIINLDLSNSPNLKELDCSMNSINNLNINNCIHLEHLECFSNNLSVLNLQNLSVLRVLYCGQNNLTTLDLSDCRLLDTLLCSNNNLTSLFIKNGAYEGNPDFVYNYIEFNNNPNLEFICCDDFQLNYMQLKVNSYGYSNCNINTYCSFVPGGQYFTFQGNTKFDSNNNGCDTNDINYSNLNFSITDGVNSGTLITNSSGNYNIPVQAGSHTITPNLENPNYFNISPSSFTVNFPTQASPFTQDFCVTANGIRHDVEVVILPTVPARPGFDAKYKIIYRNKGNQIENGAITFTYNDAVLDYVSANPVYDSQATDSFTWNYINLQPFETREIEVVLNVNSPMETPAVNIDDQLNFLAEISPMVNDEVLFDNTSSLKQTVVGSYDPNDKICLEGETVGPDMIGEYVHYLIRFENTGTYPAENVVVKDMIDLAKFDFATLIPLKGSHDFYTRIKDNKVEFIFENINLDFNDATNDGYVAFKIKTKSNLTVGSTFSNNANIYFDYNFPITTNTYTTTIQALSSQDFVFSNQFTLYPNPAKEVLNFQSKENLNIQSVEIYNMLGQIVISVPNATTSIDVSSLKSGNYFVKVNTEKGSANTKFVKE